MAELPFDNNHCKRQYPRKALTGNAVVFADGRTLLSDLVQISEGGAMLSSEYPMIAGNEIVVHFVVQTSYVRAKAKIIYILPADTDVHKQKLGIRFVEISDNDRKKIREFTASLD